MTRRLKAIPTTYHGIEFRSKLEARYATAFDKLGITWEYEGHGFAFDDGTWYCPDFYMPDIDTYFEVKGVFDGASVHKMQMLASEGEKVVYGTADGTIGVYETADTPSGMDDQVTEEIRKRMNGALFGSVMMCKGCGTWYFEHMSNAQGCPRCGERFYVRDNEPNPIYMNLFEAAGWSHGR